jgi:uncharacterized protein
MKFTDAVTVAGTWRTGDGYLIAEARCVRTGVQIYSGDEVGKPEQQIVRVYRAPEEVFAPDSLQSFTHAPVTVDHPQEEVTADNWKTLAVGEVSTAAKQDGRWVYLPLVLKDAAAIASIEAGKRQLSAGYRCELDWTSGVTADGEPFDAQQKAIRINHLALVDRARAGSEARIGDGAAQWGASPVTPAAEKEGQMADLRKVLVDGLQVETTDAGAQAITKLQQSVSDAEAKFADAERAHAEAIAARDAELAQKDAEIDDLKSKVLDTTALDAWVRARADLVATAKVIAKDVKTDGLSDADIRRAVVSAKLGDAAVKDKPEAYIDARFDILAEDAAKAADPVRDALMGGLKTVGDAATDAEGAWQQSVTDLNAWRKEA